MENAGGGAGGRAAAANEKMMKKKKKDEQEENEEEDEDDYMNMVIVEPEKPKGRETYTQRRIRKEREVVHSLFSQPAVSSFYKNFLPYNSVLSSHSSPFPFVHACFACARLCFIYFLFVRFYCFFFTISEGTKNGGSNRGGRERGAFLAMNILFYRF